MKRSVAIIFGLILSCGLAGGPLAAQQPASDAATEGPAGQFAGDVDVTEVLLDVLVTDRQGNVIVGLGPDDFVVEEAGAEIPVNNVTFYSNRRLAGPLPQGLDGEISIDTLPEDRYFILFFDDQRHRNSDTSLDLVARQLDAARFAKQWVREELLPHDWVAVASYDFRLKVQTDFTRDKGRITDAIDAAARGRDTGATWPSRVKDDEAGPSLVSGVPSGKALAKATPRIYSGIELLADAVGPIRGRKNMLLFTIGFGQLNSWGQYLEDPRYYPSMMETLNENNVAVYTIDLTPLEVQHAMSDAMNQLAEETGGRYFFNFTSFMSPLTDIATENNGYYLLSYSGRHPVGASGFQEVEVRTKNPEFRVKAREGYRFGDADRGAGGSVPTQRTR